LADIAVDEIVDLIEVLLALAGTLGHSENETLHLLKAKRAERGGFENGIVLEETRAT
jgi:predicted house-cleaning noncanonical NTP pyrophosphatase (MazG superfamily)